MGVESFLSTRRDLLQAVFCQFEKPCLLVLWRAHNSDGLWQHHLVGAVRVQVDAGEESCLSGVSMDPAERNEAVLVLDQEEFLLVLCVAIIRASILLGNDDVGYGELIPHQLTTEDPTGLHASGSVGISQLEEFMAQLSGDNDLAKGIHACSVFCAPQSTRFQRSVHNRRFG